MYDREMDVFVHGHVCRGALVAAALTALARSVGAADGAAPAADAGVAAAADGGADAGLDGGPIVDTYIDPGCGCRTASTNARGACAVVALLALVARRRNRSSHSLR
jgi:MYXO-CTERM domain-containing protein